MRAVLTAMVLVALGACAPLRRHEFARVCMGVEARVVLYAPDRSRAEAAAGVAFVELARLDAMMSDYRESSEVSEVGRRAGLDSVGVSPEMIEVLETAIEVSRASGGAFDVTAAPLTRAWREARRTGRLPDGLASLRERTDWNAIEIDGGRVRLARKGMALDLGGIAKGYAAERAVQRLRRAGCPRALVAIAGDVAVGDAPPDEAGWRIEVRPSKNSEPIGVLSLVRASVSTSGDSEQFIEIDGHRYSHIVDPRTGLGSERQVAATVVAPSGAVADALATAACLLSVEQASGMLRAFPGVSVIVVDGGGVRVLGALRALRWHEPPVVW